MTAPGERGWVDDPEVERIVTSVVAAAARRFPPAGKGSLSLTLVLPDRRRVRGHSHRGAEPVYPASLVKLFFLVAAEAWLEGGRTGEAGELDRALAAMIRHSGNDATAYVLDALTGTTAGPDLPAGAFSRWLRKRQAVNRYFARWRCPEFDNMNLTQKTWSEAPYGREATSVALAGNRNQLSSDSVARLLLAIRRGEAVGRHRSRRMMRLLERRIAEADDRHDPMNQVLGFFGEGLPPGARIWSKAGWTSSVRHDAAIVRLASGREFILVAMVRGSALAGNRKLLPFIAREIAQQLRDPKVRWNRLRSPRLRRRSRS